LIATTPRMMPAIEPMPQSDTTDATSEAMANAFVFVGCAP
jgi:hypothetical protein